MYKVSTYYWNYYTPSLY